MFAEEIRRAAEAAPRARLHEVSAALWKAFAAGGVSEDEAGEISGLIEVRKAVPATPATVSRRVGSRPRTDASMERRRRWAASGRLPPQIAARFTLAEVAVLGVVTAEAVKRGDCRLCLDHIAAIAGVSRSTVRAALRQARRLGLVSIEERRCSAWRNLSNIVRIESREWQAWMRLARRASEPGRGGKSSRPTNTGASEKARQRPAGPSHGLPEGSGRPARKGEPGIRANGIGGRAMR